MTEGHESDFLVTVRAQVMTRDESTEGWLPLAGGGLANVSIRKRARLSPLASGHDYIIYGQRISDQSVILSCVINRDLKYYKVMPTFHHWRAGKQRNGLTFQTAADARAFDKGVLRAYNELIDGLAKSNPTIICPPLTKYDSVGEDDVFMTLDLPVESESLQKIHSSPEGSEKSHKSASDRHKDSYSNNSDSEKLPAATIHYISTDKTSTAPPGNAGSSSDAPPPPPTAAGQIAPSENYSYVTLTAVHHDYNYPVVEQPVGAQVLNARRESITALKKRNALEAAQAMAAAQTSASSLAASKPLHKPNVSDILKKETRLRCRYCHELYSEDFNRRGACEYAPDPIRSGYECISGMGCARCMIYHCMSDAEGETAQHPCDCSISEAGCTKRWLGLALLSLIVPCLWCYPPLRACHWMGIHCGICGARHKPHV
ncbi:sprouty-related, EVH1 domain-containing protein 1 [Drosophila sulfurigaster albostrigata]|uniref:sprouty-related, EVH1 domain-containing protein 1 n=1 Tax=Drosophila sulfurigaster albostrigata TaxID=89887 RepID=UPI002D21950D|nr:sprouty-related, EVH1 domain-containing protein 1 [Drosophila sulfurigaster albostrigata]